MNQDLPENDARKYFFGELGDAELTAFEDKFFAEAEFSDWLEEIETDLIDDYVNDELTASEKIKFEEKYLVSNRRQARVKAALALSEMKRAGSPAVVVGSGQATIWQQLKEFFTVPQLAFAAPLILLLALLGGLFFFLRQTPTELVDKGNKNINSLPTPTIFPSVTPEISPTPTVSPDSDKTPLKTPTPIAKPTPLPTEKETPRPIEPPQPMVATITLFPSLRSDGETKKVALKKETKSLYLRLSRDLDSDFDRYLIEVRDGGGNLISTQNLSAKKAIGVSIPTKNLSNGSYKITLKGAKTDEDFKTVGFYNFSVEKK